MGGLLDAELEFFPTDQFGWDNIALGRGDSDIAGAAIPINSNKRQVILSVFSWTYQLHIGGQVFGYH